MAIFFRWLLPLLLLLDESGRLYLSIYFIEIEWRDQKMAHKPFPKWSKSKSGLPLKSSWIFNVNDYICKSHTFYFSRIDSKKTPFKSDRYTYTDPHFSSHTSTNLCAWIFFFNSFFPFLRWNLRRTFKIGLPWPICYYYNFTIFCV